MRDASFDAEEIERRLRYMQEWRAKLKMLPLADDDAYRRSLIEAERQRRVKEIRGLERQLAEFEMRMQRLEAWRERPLAESGRLKVVARMGEVECRSLDGTIHRLPGPTSPAIWNELGEYEQLNDLGNRIVQDAGVAWTRIPESAQISPDERTVTIRWVATAHEIESGAEAMVGWQRSDQLVQPMTWIQVTINGRFTLRCVETGQTA